MKDTDLLRALGGIPQEYIDELTVWQQDCTPLSPAQEETEPQPAAVPVRAVPEPVRQTPGKEKITMKKNERSAFTVRSFRPLTAGILAALTACAVLAVGLGVKLGSSQEPDISAASAPETTETHTEYAEEPAVSSQLVSSAVSAEYSVTCCYYYGSDIDLQGDDMLVRLHDGGEGSAYLRDGQDEDFQKYLTNWKEQFGEDAPAADSLLVGFPLLENGFSYAVRGITLDNGTLHLNFSVYRNPNLPSPQAENGAQNAYFLIQTHYPGMPGYTGYDISYTVYDSDYRTNLITGREEPEASRILESDPVYLAYEAAILGPKPVRVTGPGGTATRYPKYTLVTQLPCAIPEPAMMHLSAFSVYNPELQDSTYPAELQNTIAKWHAQFADMHILTLLAVPVSTQDAACVIRDTCIQADGTLAFGLTVYYPEVCAESEGTFVTAYLTDENVLLHPENLAMTVKTLMRGDTQEAWEAYGEPTSDPFTVLMSDSNFVPCIRLAPLEELSAVTDAPEVPAETTVTTATADESEPLLAAPTDIAGDDNIAFDIPSVRAAVKDLFDTMNLPDAMTITPEGERLLFSNSFVRDAFGLWFRPDDEQTRNIMTERFLHMNFLDSIQTPDEYDGGGFLLRMEEDDNTVTTYEFYNKDLIVRTLYENGTAVSVTCLADTTGMTDTLIRELTDYQLAYDAEINRLREAALEKLRAEYNNTDELVIEIPE